MTPRRHELSDFEWSIIEPLLPNKPRGVARADDRCALNGLLAAAHRLDLGRNYGALRTIDHLLQSLRPVGKDRRVGWRRPGIMSIKDHDGPRRACLTTGVTGACPR
jgi:transposase